MLVPKMYQHWFPQLIFDICLFFFSALFLPKSFIHLLSSSHLPDPSLSIETMCFAWCIELQLFPVLNESASPFKNPCSTPQGQIFFFKRKNMLDRSLQIKQTVFSKILFYFSL